MPVRPCRPLHGYRRHEPEKTLLHAVMREQLETLLAEARERTSHGLPAFVERELRGYLDCGLLSRLLAIFTRTVFARRRGQLTLF